jgi:hypothetical protein
MEVELWLKKIAPITELQATTFRSGIGWSSKRKRADCLALNSAQGELYHEAVVPSPVVAGTKLEASSNRE